MRREKTHSFSFLRLSAPPEQLLGSKTRRGCSVASSDLPGGARCLLCVPVTYVGLSPGPALPGLHRTLVFCLITGHLNHAMRSSRNKTLSSQAAW